jgi:hypothetical protein
LRDPPELEAHCKSYMPRPNEARMGATNAAGKEAAQPRAELHRYAAADETHDPSYLQRGSRTGNKELGMGGAIGLRATHVKSLFRSSLRFLHGSNRSTYLFDLRCKHAAGLQTQCFVIDRCKARHESYSAGWRSMRAHARAARMTGHPATTQRLHQTLQTQARALSSVTPIEMHPCKHAAPQNDA